MSYKKNLKVLENIWGKNSGDVMICPQCEGSLTMIQVEPIYERDSLYLPYKTVIECDSCSFIPDATNNFWGSRFCRR